MSEQESRLEIERILVALDASPHSLSALQAALDLAEQLQAELCGLFVEDANVRRLADLPSVQEIGLFSFTRRQINLQELSCQLRAQACEMRRYFEVSTKQASVRCSYREARGRVEMEILSAASEADVVILGKGAWSPLETGELGPAVRKVVSGLGISAMVLQAGARLEVPILTVYDGSELSRKGMQAAAALAEQENGHITVVILADEAEKGRALKEELERQYGDASLQISFLLLASASIARLGDLVEQGSYGLMVLPAHSERIEDGQVLDILDEVEIPVLLVQGSEAAGQKNS